MDIIGTEQIFTVALFLGVMGLAWLAVYVNRGKLAGKTTTGRRLIVREATGLGNGERALLIEADGQPVLAVIPRKGPAQLLALPRTTQAEDAE